MRTTYVSIFSDSYSFIYLTHICLAPTNCWTILLLLGSGSEPEFQLQGQCRPDDLCSASIIQDPTQSLNNPLASSVTGLACRDEIGSERAQLPPKVTVLMEEFWDNSGAAAQEGLMPAWGCCPTPGQCPAPASRVGTPRRPAPASLPAAPWLHLARRARLGGKHGAGHAPC